jgi:hypothetical protein
VIHYRVVRSFTVLQLVQRRQQQANHAWIVWVAFHQLVEQRPQTPVMAHRAVAQVLRGGALLWGEMRVVAPDIFQRLGEIAAGQHLADGVSGKLLAFIQNQPVKPRLTSGRRALPHADGC